MKRRVLLADGAEALSHLEHDGPIDLVLLNLMMLTLNGLEVCKRLKRNPKTAALPIILFSTSESYATRLIDLCLECHANDWVKKPFSSQDLLEKIQKAMSAGSVREPSATAPQPGTEGRSPEALIGSRRSTRILVVDDDPAIREFFLHTPAASGYEVVAVESGKEAAVAVRQAPFGIAFVDIVMREMDGLATLKVLLAVQPTLRVIMITAYKVEDTVTLALHFGATDFLYKPFEDSAGVLKTIHKVMNQH